MGNKKYFWIKLKKDFFRSKEMKLLRRIAGGDTYTIIYLKMLLASADSGGILKYESICESIAEEIALDIDEEIENVEVTLTYLKSKGLLEVNEEGDCFLPETLSMTGSETSAAERMRKSRERKKLQEDKKELRCNNVTPMLQDGYTEIDIELEIDKDKEIDGWIDKDKKVIQPPIQPAEIIKWWNGNRVRNKISESVIRYCNKELSSLLEIYTSEDVKRAIYKIGESKYLMHSITFDWFLKSENFKKVLLGGYDEFNYREVQGE